MSWHNPNPIVILASVEDHIASQRRSTVLFSIIRSSKFFVFCLRAAVLSYDSNDSASACFRVLPFHGMEIIIHERVCMHVTQWCICVPLTIRAKSFRVYT